jgi:hypothetical protein
MLKHVATLLHRRLAAKALLKPISALIVRKIPQKYNKTQEANAIHQMNELKYSLVLNAIMEHLEQPTAENVNASLHLINLVAVLRHEGIDYL